MRRLLRRVLKQAGGRRWKNDESGRYFLAQQQWP
jgi:hypothetical protein